MNKQTLATDFRKNADNVHLAKISPLYDEIIKECERLSRKGKYECSYSLGNKYSNEEIAILRDKLHASKFKTNFYTLQTIKTSPKWYEFKKKPSYYTEIIVNIKWENELEGDLK